MASTVEDTGLMSADRTPSAEILRARLARELGEHGEPIGKVPSVSDHTLLHRIGCGSYGDVWLARSALGTFRAVKIVYRARFKDEKPYEREFQGILKYEPVSRMHEGLIQVLHVGRNDSAGCFYYVMELADNANTARQSSSGTLAVDIPAEYSPRTLASDLAQQKRFPPTEAANLTLQLTKALGYLHRMGLVHRDIKPGNVIFVRGNPRLADIGLVTDVGSSRSFVGTDGFIPPEGPGAPPADLFALGKLLYELATGRDRMDFPQLPARVDRLAGGELLLELNEVITRACAPNVQDRYATAAEIEADLNSFLSGRSLRRARRLERYFSRLKRVVAVGSVVVVLLAIALLFSKREERHAHETARLASERARTEIEGRRKETSLRLRAEAAEAEKNQQLFTALLDQARATVRSGEPGQRVRALEAIRRAAALSNSLSNRISGSDLRPSRDHLELKREALAALALPDIQFEQDLLLNAEFTLRWMDPTFERIAVCRGRGAVEIRTLPENQLLATLPASTNLVAWGGTWSPDGRYLAVKRDYDDGGRRADLEVWDIENLHRILLLRDVRFNSRSFHPHKPQLLVAEAEGWISAWDLRSGDQIARRKFDAVPENLAYSPSGDLVAASYRMTNEWGVSIHKAVDGELLVSQVFSNFPSAVVWHPDETGVAITDYGGQVHWMDARSGELRWIGQHQAQAATAMFVPTGDYLVTGGWERELIFWNFHTGQRVLTIPFDSYVVQFRSDGLVCALYTQSGIQFHRFENSTVHRELTPHMGPRLWHAAFSPDGRWLAASADRRVGLWDLQNDAPGTFVNVESETQLFWSDDSRELFASSRANSSFRWQVKAGTHATASPSIEKLNLASPAGFASLCLASNRVVWTTSAGSRWDFGSTVANQEWVETAFGISRASPDSRWMGIYRPYDSVLHVYNLPGLDRVASLTNIARIGGFSFSPSGDEVAVSSRGQVEFWSTSTWTQTRVVPGFNGIPHLGVVYERQGDSIWLLKEYNSAGRYNAETLAPVLLLPSRLAPLALDSKENHLAVSVDAQKLQVWDLVAVQKRLRDLGLD